MAKIVIGLGGNALGDTPEEQKKLIKSAAVNLVDLIEAGHQLILSHGNGPQVGMTKLAFDTTHKENPKVPSMPLCECTAMTQGYIGFHMQNLINNELLKRGIKKKIASIVSQTLVDKADPAFSNPTKPIGSFLTKEEADALAKKGVTVMEDAGRGYRQSVPSPTPIDIVEKDVLRDLIDNGTLVIAGGGGGIPVVKEGNAYVGVEAVIDKDKSCAVIAKLVDADYFIILTAVEQVALNYGTPQQKFLSKVTKAEMEQYTKEGHFAPGSMLPKVEAALDFVSNKKGATAIITSLEKVLEGVNGEAGTRIVAN